MTTSIVDSDVEKQSSISDGAGVRRRENGEELGLDQTTTSGNVLLTSDEILKRARKNPEDTSTVYLTYSKDDRDNPRNWPKWKKWYITLLCNAMNIITCIVAGGISSASADIAEEFSVSSEVTTLCLSLYILGFAVGPLLLAPLSEYYGRNAVWYSSWFLLVIFNIPLALAPNIGTIIICRLLQGIFGSPPLTNTGGTISDLWKRNDSGGPMAIYGVSSTFGPPIALVISGYLVLEKGWRWLFWVDMAITGGFWIIIIFTLPETRHTTILDRKAKRLGKHLKKEGLPHEHILDANADEKKGLHTLFAITLTRPFHFLFTEPITYCAAIYNGFIYGLVYIFNEAFPLVFGPSTPSNPTHNFNTGQWGLTFLGLAIGPLIGAALYYPTQERYYLSRVAQNDGKGVPEARIWTARWGAFLPPISLFWFAWTSYPSVHWIVPIIASVLFGLGIYIVILSILSYVIDAYQTYSASALAGVILVRNLVGAGFPLFAAQMYKTLGNEWASSLLAFLSIPMIVIPWLLFYKGEVIRQRSPWASQHLEQDEDRPH